MANDAPDDYNARLREILSMAGVSDPRLLGLSNELMTQEHSSPMSAAEAVGGKPDFYQGSKLGAYIYPPGPIQQSHPFLAGMAGQNAIRNNEAERRRIREVLARIGGGMPGGQSPVPMRSMSRQPSQQAPDWMGGLGTSIGVGSDKLGMVDADARAYMEMMARMGMGG